MMFEIYTLLIIHIGSKENMANQNWYAAYRNLNYTTVQYLQYSTYSVSKVNIYFIIIQG